MLIDSAIVPGDSWAKIKIDTNPAFGLRGESPEGFLPPLPGGTEFNFYFLWQNDSPLGAVVNVSSILILNGACEVDSMLGTFSGDLCTLSMEASLSPLQWWNQPPTLPVAEPSQVQSVANLSAQGGGFWDNFLTLESVSVDTTTQLFTFAPYALRYEMFAIPANSTAVFEVSLKVAYDFPSGANTSDHVSADFASDASGYSVVCPFVLLEVLPSRSNVLPGSGLVKP